MTTHSICWKKCIGICTDGARALVGEHKGVISLIKKVAPEAVSTHCSIHREALVAKNIPEELKTVLNQAITMVNFVKARALNARLFSILCQEMGSEHEKLLHTDVRWLSKGKVLNRLFELRSELQVFLCESNFELKTCIFDERWLARLAYLADIFGKLNDLNVSLQGPTINTFTVRYKIDAIIKKLDLIIKEVDKNTLNFLPTLEDFINENNLTLEESLKSNIKNHCQQLISSFKYYFPGDVKKEDWIRNPFSLETVPDYLSTVEKEQLIDLS